MSWRTALLLFCVPSITLAATYDYFVPVIGQTRGAAASYTVHLSVTNLSATDTYVTVMNLFMAKGWICRRHDLGEPVLIRGNATVEFNPVGCENLGSMGLRSDAPIAIVADIDEVPTFGSGIPGSTQPIPIGVSLFQANTMALIPDVNLSLYSPEPIRANLFVSAADDFQGGLATVTITSFRTDTSGQQTSTVQTAQIDKGYITIVPLRDVPAEKITVSVDMPFYAAASVVRGVHGLFRAPSPLSP